MAGARTPGIMADSAYVILTSNSRKTTDNFFLDDEVLISRGETIDTLAKYMPKDAKELSKLVPDFMC
jgi:citronellol/citronellal dehydrogenase